MTITEEPQKKEWEKEYEKNKYCPICGAEMKASADVFFKICPNFKKEAEHGAQH
jgi:NADH pyrophosphatase NudC (nudix superfamily)